MASTAVMIRQNPTTNRFEFRYICFDGYSEYFDEVFDWYKRKDKIDMLFPSHHFVGIGKGMLANTPLKNEYFRENDLLDEMGVEKELLTLNHFTTLQSLLDHVTQLQPKYVYVIDTYSGTYNEVEL